MNPFINKRLQQAYPLDNTCILSISTGLIRDIKLICSAQLNPYISSITCSDKILLVTLSDPTEGLLGTFRASNNDQFCTLRTQRTDITGTMIAGLITEAAYMSNVALAPQCIQHAGTLEGYTRCTIGNQQYKLGSRLYVKVGGTLSSQNGVISQTLQYPMLSLSLYEDANLPYVHSLNGKQADNISLQFDQTVAASLTVYTQSPLVNTLVIYVSGT